MTIKLKNVNFEFKGGHLTYTSKGQGGAASGLNDPVILKSGKQAPTEDQKKILEDIKEEFTPLLKQHKSNTTDSPSSVEGDTGEETNLTKGNKKLMSDQKQEELIKSKDDRIAALQEQLANIENKQLKESLAGYKLADSESVTKALSTMDEAERDVIIKALGELDARAVNEDVGDIEKEYGEDGDAEQEPELKLAEKVQQEIIKLRGSN